MIDRRPDAPRHDVLPATGRMRRDHGPISAAASRRLAPTQASTDSGAHVDDERRATRQALRDWERLRFDGSLPALSDLAPHRNPVEWANRFLLACDPDAIRSVVVLCGPKVEAAFGRRLIGQALSDVAPRHVSLLRGCAEASRTQMPVEVEDAHLLDDGRILAYRAVFLPVRGSEHDHGYLMGTYGCTVVTP